MDRDRTLLNDILNYNDNNNLNYINIKQLFNNAQVTDGDQAKVFLDYYRRLISKGAAKSNIKSFDRGNIIFANSVDEIYNLIKRGNKYYKIFFQLCEYLEFLLIYNYYVHMVNGAHTVNDGIMDDTIVLLILMYHHNNTSNTTKVSCDNLELLIIINNIKNQKCRSRYPIINELYSFHENNLQLLFNDNSKLSLYLLEPKNLNEMKELVENEERNNTISPAYIELLQQGKTIREYLCQEINKFHEISPELYFSIMGALHGNTPCYFMYSCHQYYKSCQDYKLANSKQSGELTFIEKCLKTYIQDVENKENDKIKISSSRTKISKDTSFEKDIFKKEDTFHDDLSSILSFSLSDEENEDNEGNGGREYNELVTKTREMMESLRSENIPLYTHTVTYTLTDSEISGIDFDFLKYDRNDPDKITIIVSNVDDNNYNTYSNTKVKLRKYMILKKINGVDVTNITTLEDIIAMKKPGKPNITFEFETPYSGFFSKGHSQASEDDAVLRIVRILTFNKMTPEQRKLFKRNPRGIDYRNLYKKILIDDKIQEEFNKIYMEIMKSSPPQIEMSSSGETATIRCFCAEYIGVTLHNEDGHLFVCGSIFKNLAPTLIKYILITINNKNISEINTEDELVKHLEKYFNTSIINSAILEFKKPKDGELEAITINRSTKVDNPCNLIEPEPQPEPQPGPLIRSVAKVQKEYSLAVFQRDNYFIAPGESLVARDYVMCKDDVTRYEVKLPPLTMRNLKPNGNDNFEQKIEAAYKIFVDSLSKNPNIPPERAESLAQDFLKRSPEDCIKIFKTKPYNNVEGSTKNILDAIIKMDQYAKKPLFEQHAPSYDVEIREDDYKHLKLNWKKGKSGIFIEQETTGNLKDQYPKELKIGDVLIEVQGYSKVIAPINFNAIFSHISVFKTDETSKRLKFMRGPREGGDIPPPLSKGRMADLRDFNRSDYVIVRSDSVHSDYLKFNHDDNTEKITIPLERGTINSLGTDESSLSEKISDAQLKFIKKMGNRQSLDNFLSQTPEYRLDLLESPQENEKLHDGTKGILTAIAKMDEYTYPPLRRDGLTQYTVTTSEGTKGLIFQYATNTSPFEIYIEENTGLDKELEGVQKGDILIDVEGFTPPITAMNLTKIKKYIASYRTVTLTLVIPKGNLPSHKYKTCDLSLFSRESYLIIEQSFPSHDYVMDSATKYKSDLDYGTMSGLTGKNFAARIKFAKEYFEEKHDCAIEIFCDNMTYSQRDALLLDETFKERCKPFTGPILSILKAIIDVDKYVTGIDLRDFSDWTEKEVTIKPSTKAKKPIELEVRDDGSIRISKINKGLSDEFKIGIGNCLIHIEGYQKYIAPVYLQEIKQKIIRKNIQMTFLIPPEEHIIEEFRKKHRFTLKLFGRPNYFMCVVTRTFSKSYYIVDKHDILDERKITHKDFPKVQLLSLKMDDLDGNNYDEQIRSAYDNFFKIFEVNTEALLKANADEFLKETHPLDGRFERLKNSTQKILNGIIELHEKKGEIKLQVSPDINDISTTMGVSLDGFGFTDFRLYQMSIYKKDRIKYKGEEVELPSLTMSRLKQGDETYNDIINRVAREFREACPDGINEDCKLNKLDKSKLKTLSQGIRNIVEAIQELCRKIPRRRKPRSSSRRRRRSISKKSSHSSYSGSGSEYTDSDSGSGSGSEESSHSSDSGLGSEYTDSGSGSGSGSDSDSHSGSSSRSSSRGRRIGIGNGKGNGRRIGIGNGRGTRRSSSTDSQDFQNTPQIIILSDSDDDNDNVENPIIEQIEAERAAKQIQEEKKEESRIRRLAERQRDVSRYVNNINTNPSESLTAFKRLCEQDDKDELLNINEEVKSAENIVRTLNSSCEKEIEQIKTDLSNKTEQINNKQQALVDEELINKPKNVSISNRNVIAELTKIPGALDIDIKPIIDLVNELLLFMNTEKPKFEKDNTDQNTAEKFKKYSDTLYKSVRNISNKINEILKIRTDFGFGKFLDIIAENLVRHIASIMTSQEFKIFEPIFKAGIKELELLPPSRQLEKLLELYLETKKSELTEITDDIEYLERKLSKENVEQHRIDTEITRLKSSVNNEESAELLRIEEEEHKEVSNRVKKTFKQLNKLKTNKYYCILSINDLEVLQSLNNNSIEELLKLKSSDGRFHRTVERYNLRSSALKTSGEARYSQIEKLVRNNLNVERTLNTRIKELTKKEELQRIRMGKIHARLKKDCIQKITSKHKYTQPAKLNDDIVECETALKECQTTYMRYAPVILAQTAITQQYAEMGESAKIYGIIGEPFIKQLYEEIESYFKTGLSYDTSIPKIIIKRKKNKEYTAPKPPNGVITDDKFKEFVKQGKYNPKDYNIEAAPSLTEDTPKNKFYAQEKTRQTLKTMMIHHGYSIKLAVYKKCVKLGEFYPKIEALLTSAEEVKIQFLNCIKKQVAWKTEVTLDTITEDFSAKLNPFSHICTDTQKLVSDIKSFESICEKFKRDLDTLDSIKVAAEKANAKKAAAKTDAAEKLTSILNDFNTALTDILTNLVESYDELFSAYFESFRKSNNKLLKLASYSRDIADANRECFVTTTKRHLNVRELEQELDSAQNVNDDKLALIVELEDELREISDENDKKINKTEELLKEWIAHYYKYPNLVLRADALNVELLYCKKLAELKLQNKKELKHYIELRQKTENELKRKEEIEKQRKENDVTEKVREARKAQTELKRINQLLKEIEPDIKIYPISNINRNILSKSGKSPLKRKKKIRRNLLTEARSSPKEIFYEDGILLKIDLTSSDAVRLLNQELKRRQTQLNELTDITGSKKARKRLQKIEEIQRKEKKRLRKILEDIETAKMYQTYIAELKEEKLKAEQKAAEAKQKAAETQQKAVMEIALPIHAQPAPAPPIDAQPGPYLEPHPET